MFHQLISNKIFSLMEVFTKSLVFAAEKHKSQRRKQEGDIPYINHPLEVAHILSLAGVKDYEILSAAILHDTVQDTETTPEELEQEFGKRVKDLVIQCTDNKALGKSERKKYQIVKAESASNDAKLIKIADKISNNRGLLVRAPVKWTANRIQGYFLWSQIVCSKLRGVNEVLDKEIEAVFEKSGINKLSNEEKEIKLQTYYTSLDQGQ